MTTLREAAQQALEALEYHVEQTRPIWKTSQAIDALRAALEQPDRVQQQRDAGYTRRPTLREMAEQPVALMDAPLLLNGQPLFTHPPRREWRGLTDTERAAVQFESFKRGLSPLEFMELHEAALKEKNHE